MTIQAWAFASVAALGILLGWLASWRRWRMVVVVTRPAAMASLGGAVLWLPGLDRGVVAAVALGLGCNAVGDALLAMPSHRFAAGSTAFLAARCSYSAAFVLMGIDAGRALLVLIVSGFALMTLGRVLLGQVRRLRPRLAVGAMTFMAVSACSIALGVGTGRPLIGLAVVTLSLADLFLGWNRFVRALSGGHGTIHVVAHGAQVMLAAALVSW